uniref:Uncharacterized protein n=1 Tax=Oryza brachyantha TaxID=4533 RepID=J3N7B8_ORYBR
MLVLEITKTVQIRSLGSIGGGFTDVTSQSAKNILKKFMGPAKQIDRSFGLYCSGFERLHGTSQSMTAWIN